jgi:hypothetical protein
MKIRVYYVKHSWIIKVFQSIAGPGEAADLSGHDENGTMVAPNIERTR